MSEKLHIIFLVNASICIFVMMLEVIAERKRLFLHLVIQFRFI